MEKLEDSIKYKKMKEKSTIFSVKVEDLVLDKDNPRFAELYSGSDKEEEIIEYLLYTESAEDVAKSISAAQEFYPDRPLWVLKDGNKYLVKDGNRRCAAVKALLHPIKFGLDSTKMDFKELPVLIYQKRSDLDTRIRQEHTSNLFRPWGRIAKALEIYRLFSSGSSLESMTEYDSSPKDLIKLASFYYEAVKISSEDFKKLLRSGKGKSGGKTIIFERLFKYKNECGYTFKSKSTNEISLKDSELFSSYILAMVKYLKKYPETTSRDIDQFQRGFLSKLNPYGFVPKKESNSNTDTEDTNNSKPSRSNNTSQSESQIYNSNSNTGNNHDSTNNDSDTNSDTSNPSETNKQKTKKKSIKNRPVYERKKIPPALEKLIKECYNLDQNNFPNAKTASTRVVFECTLKYVVENTKQINGNILVKSNHFRSAYYDKKGNKSPYTNFKILKTKFTELINNTGIRKAFEGFDLQRSHQIIHNYRVGAVPADAKGICDNLIDLLEFMLQENDELMNAIDSSKL